MEKPYPTAEAIPGKPGQVYSPYNHRAVDVDGLGSGKLVRDPTYPAAEKKFFYTP